MNASEITIRPPEVLAAMGRAARALEAAHDRLTELDQAMGDGDLGITAVKIAGALNDYMKVDPGEDLGKWLSGAGMAVNRAASSTMGTLLATGLMRAGKQARGLPALTPGDLAAMLQAADLGIQERGKAQLGQKTLVDALHPATEAFAAAIQQGCELREAGTRMAAAAQAGCDRVTPLKSSTGRASWVGERTVGLVDPGCEAIVILLKALAG
jgi:dihydroxyacetone kinase-like protein